MNKRRLNLNWCLAEGKSSSASLREEGARWDIAGVRSRSRAEPFGEMQLINRYDPLETQKMLDMAG